MTYDGLLGITASWAAILTAVVATVAYGRFLWAQNSQRWIVERHLRSEKQAALDSGQRTVLHLMARLSLTEAEVLSAAFRSNKISPVVGVNDEGRADTLLFEYSGEDLPAPKKF